MTNNVVAHVRRSSLVSTYGVGSLLPAGEDSVMICGLDDWPAGPLIVEPRLTTSLGVHELRGPRSSEGLRGDVPAVRFPFWAFCPGCRKLGPFRDIADPSRRCRRCADLVSPSRFVSCCTAGHIEDFPYRSWVHEAANTPAEGHQLSIIARGHTSALGDLIVRCECGRERSMEGSFDSGAMRGIRRCSGSRPWLIGVERVTCDEPLRTLQRGSSNVWFSMTRSAISIPSVANRAAEFAEFKFKDANPDADPAVLAASFPPPPGCTIQDVGRAIERMRVRAVTQERLSDRELRDEEYRALVNGLDDEYAGDQFLCRTLDISSSDLPPFIAQLSRVGRLREVRALTGFTRVVPATDSDEGRLDVLASTRPTWLPAMEVLGEGIFVRLNEETLTNWCRGSLATERVRLLLNAAEPDGAGGSFRSVPDMSARSLLLHSLAHILIDELSLTAGYPTASIRERIYDDGDQAGILLYTATADSAGSLGGLAAQSEPARFGGVLRNALDRARWCTSDPVCIESHSSGVNGMNLAACHACMLLPETSCERFNQMLDRATLIGLPDADHAGFAGARIE